MRIAYSCMGLALLLAAGCAQNGSDVKPPAPAPQSQDAATTALGTLRLLVTEQNARSMGFESLDEVKSATLGQPLPVFNIGLDQLKAYKPGADVNALLAPSGNIIYPVTANGQVRSSVTIVRVEGGYKPSSFGNAAIVRALSQYRGQGESFAVRVPALNMYFAGQRVENRLLLTPIADDPRLKAKAGSPVPAEEVLTELVVVANAYNGLPM